MEEQNNIEQEAPILFGLEKKQSLEVPKNYFNELPSELSKIANNKTKSSVLSFNKNWIYTIAIAASIIVGAFIIVPTEKALNEEVIAYNNSFNNLTAEDFELFMLVEENDYLTSNVDFDDTEELQFFASELQKPLKTIEITEEDFEDYFESEIEDY
jgi:hypothetical protein